MSDYVEADRLDFRFDASMMNGLQAVDSWDTCEQKFGRLILRFEPFSSLPFSSFNPPRSYVCNVLPWSDLVSALCSYFKRWTRSKRCYLFWQYYYDDWCHHTGLLEEL